VLTFVDLGPRLITVTHHDAVAGPYHRNGRDIIDVMRAFRGSAENARATIERRRIDYVLICPGLSESTIYASQAKGGFYTQLAAARCRPGWRRCRSPPSRPTGCGGWSDLEADRNAVDDELGGERGEDDAEERVIIASMRWPSSASAARRRAATPGSGAGRASAPSTISDSARPSLRAISSMIEAIEPGPAIIGIAIGKTLMSSARACLDLLSAVLAALGAALEHHVEAIRNSMMPPAMRKRRG
jgi:hypothetical protein